MPFDPPASTYLDIVFIYVTLRYIKELGSRGKFLQNGDDEPRPFSRIFDTIPSALYVKCAIFSQKTKQSRNLIRPAQYFPSIFVSKIEFSEAILSNSLIYS